jgi:hypothetical protein
MNAHECTGGCGRPMAYPCDRCHECTKWLRSQRQIWDNAAENMQGHGLAIAREIRRDS